MIENALRAHVDPEVSISLTHGEDGGTVLTVTTHGNEQQRERQLERQRQGRAQRLPARKPSPLVPTTTVETTYSSLAAGLTAWDTYWVGVWELAADRLTDETAKTADVAGFTDTDLLHRRNRQSAIRYVSALDHLLGPAPQHMRMMVTSLPFLTVAHFILYRDATPEEREALVEGWQVMSALTDDR